MKIVKAFKTWLRNRRINKLAKGTPDSPYIPGCLDDAIHYLICSLPDVTIKYIKENGTRGMHFSIGRNLRNEWKLWDPTSPLARWFRTRGIGHADDMSGIILTTLYRTIRFELPDVEEQINYYTSYWRAQGIDPVTQEPIKKGCR